MSYTNITYTIVIHELYMCGLHWNQKWIPLVQSILSTRHEELKVWNQSTCIQRLQVVLQSPRHLLFPSFRSHRRPATGPAQHPPLRRPQALLLSSTCKCCKLVMELGIGAPASWARPMGKLTWRPLHCQSPCTANPYSRHNSPWIGALGWDTSICESVMYDSR